jgi:hypothetical protein
MMVSVIQRYTLGAPLGQFKINPSFCCHPRALAVLNDGLNYLAVDFLCNEEWQSFIHHHHLGLQNAIMLPCAPISQAIPGPAHTRCL